MIKRLSNIVKQSLLYTSLQLLLKFVGLYIIHLGLVKLGGCIWNGLLLYFEYLIITSVIIYLCNNYGTKKEQERGNQRTRIDVFIESTIVPMVFMLAFRQLQVSVYILLEGVIFLLKDKLIKKELNSKYKKPLIITGIILFGVSAVLMQFDYSTEDKLYMDAEDKISFLQAGLLQDITMEDVVKDLNESDTGDKEDKIRLIFTEKEIEENIRSYMLGELGMRSYTIELLHKPNLMVDKQTSEYFYSVYVRGYASYSIPKIYGIVMRADTGKMCYLEEVKIEEMLDEYSN